MNTITTPAADAPAAVVHHIDVPLPPALAFDLFVHQLARWWPLRSHSCGGDDACAVEVEPRVGGAVTELTRSGQRHPWGTLTAWQPPQHFAMRWHPGQPSAQATLLSVRFRAAGDGCVVELQHDGWQARDDAAAARDNYQRGWALVLDQYLRAARDGGAR